MILRIIILTSVLLLNGLAFAQQESYKIFPTCFSNSSDQFGVRKVGDQLYILSDALDADSNVIIDEYTDKAFTDLYQIEGCELKIASLMSASFGENALLSSAKYDGPISSNNSNSIVFFSNNNVREIGDKMGIYFLLKTADGWSNSIPFPVNSEKYNVIHPFFSEEMGRLYFASDMAQGKGGFDIYSIEFDGIDFGKIYAEDSINTEYNETFPQFANGGIYFTSDGHSSIGGLDIFFSQEGEIIHLPEPINTVYDDFDIHFMDESTGFFATNREYEGALDKVVYFIKSSIFPVDELAEDRNPLFTAHAGKLDLANKVLIDLLELDKSNPLYTALQLSSSVIQQKRDSINNQIHNFQYTSRNKLDEIKEQIEELILAGESLDYTVKSQKINELLLVVEEINKHSLAEDKERLFNQMNEKIISKLNSNPSSLLSNVSDYKKTLISMKRLEIEQEKVAKDMLSLSEMVEQEGTRVALLSPSLSRLSTISNSDNNQIQKNSIESETLVKLKQDNAVQLKLKEYEYQENIYLNNYKRQLLNDILSDRTKSGEEKLAVILEINDLLSSTNRFRNEEDLRVLANQVSTIQEKSGFKPSDNANNALSDLIELSYEYTYLNEKSIANQYSLVNLLENNQYVMTLLAGIENSLLIQLTDAGRLSQENSNKVTDIINKYSFDLKNTADIDESILLTKELKRLLSLEYDSLYISEQQELDLLAAHKTYLELKELKQLSEQLSYANLKFTSTGNRNQNSNKDVFVGIIQLNNKPYQLGKFLVKDSNGVILDSLFTDENGIFIYHKLKSTIATIEPVNVSPNNSFVFYNVDNATQLLSQIQAKIKNNKAFNELLLDNHLAKARLESKDGKINLANFKVPLTSELSINSPITEEVLNYKRLSKSFMNNLIQNYEINPIQFRFDSYQIQRKYYDELNELVAFVANYDQFELQIIGHTDISGHPTYNLLLSENRAKSIQRYFLRKGISNVGFMIQGVGSDKPITSNDTREGRKLNRRVEIQLKVKE